MRNAVIKAIIRHCFTGTGQEFQDWWQQHLQTGHGLQLIFTPNPEQSVLATDSDTFRDCLLSGDQLLADGAGLVWASRLEGVTLHRITGVDMTAWWLRVNRQGKVSTLLIGGRDNVAADLARQVDPDDQWCSGISGHLNVAAAHDPAYQDQMADEEQAIFDAIKKRKPQVVLVAFGAPWQEEFLCRHREQLAKLGVKIAMVCGGAFDYLTGQAPRAPGWLRAIGLEWLFRLWQEPWRWRRQLRLIRFIHLVV